MTPTRFPLLALGSALLLLLVPGCAGYRLGPNAGLTQDASSISIVPFPNQTPEPGLAPVLAAALRRQIQSEGALSLDTRGQGDVLLTGNIIAYERVGVSFQPNDIITIRDFEIRMTAEIRAIHRRTREVLLEESVVGSSLVRGFNDLASAERQARPIIANDLAQKITDLIVEGEW